MNALEGVLHQIAREVRVAANCALPGWTQSIVFSGVLAKGELEQAVPIGNYPTRSAEANELVRINLNLLDHIADPATVKFLLRMELEPFIIGVGKIRAVETSEGLVIFASKEGERIGLIEHDASTPNSGG